MVEYDWRTARQPGAQHAPFAFLSGRLFSRDIRNVYEDLHLPVYVLHGTKGDFKDFSEAGWAIARKELAVLGLRHRARWCISRSRTSSSAPTSGSSPKAPA